MESDPTHAQGFGQELNDTIDFPTASNWSLLFPPSLLIDAGLEKAINDASLVIAIFGLLANFSFIFVWVRVPGIRSVTNYFLLNLCIADLIFLLAMTTHDIIIKYIFPPAYQLSHREAACAAVLFLTALPQNTSLLSIALVSIERYIAICHPMRAKRFARKEIAYITIASIWAVATVLTIPTMLICVTDSTKVSIASLVLQISPFGLSLFTVCILYSMIIRRMHLRRSISTSESNIGKHFQTKISRDKRQVILVLLVTSFVFFICVFPYHFKTIVEISAVSSESRTLPISPRAYFILTPVTWMLLYVNSAINPVVYKIFSSKHRSAFVQAFCFCRMKGHQPAIRMVSRSSTTSTELNQSQSVSNRNKVKMLSYTNSNGLQAD
ncbi:somatostatin receptor type 5-like [Ptychodera flava]|uniref:somatostatin receptor type 5-like n=1 Tax=Ptychodera flava TaxID=63121 RepID=UPI003969CA2B